MTPEQETRIAEAAQQAGYPTEAFLFVLEEFQQFDFSEIHRHHISATELSWRLHDLAIRLFGSHAKQQLELWKIRSTEDFGKIVFAMIAAGLLAKTEEDEIEDFHQVFNFDNAFHAYHSPHSDNRLFQWRLSTLFVITFFSAIALACGTKHGISGAAMGLFLFWQGVVGGYSLFVGITNRTHGWLLMVLVGICFLAIGMGGFLFLVIL